MDDRSRLTGTRFEFSLRREEIFRINGDTSELALTGAASPRRYELALLLAEETLAGGSPSEGTLRRALAGMPTPARVRLELRHLETLGLALERDDGGWRLADGAASVHASRADLRRARERLAARLGEDRRLGSGEATTAARLREEFHAIEDAFEREEHAEVVRHLEGKAGSASLLVALPRALAPRHRSKARFLLHTFAGMAAMNFGRLGEATMHLDLAERDAEAVSGTHAIWRVRLAATRSAIRRMQAALAPNPEEQRKHLRRALEAWVEVDRLALSSKLDLDAEDRQELRRWFLVERATPLTLLADLAVHEGAGGREAHALVKQAEASVGDGQSALGKYRADPGAIVSTALLVGRVALSAGKVELAGDELAEAEDLALAPSTPRWVAGWMPRYLADLSFVEGHPPAVLGGYLMDAWARNRAHRFQRMLLLARVGGFGLGLAELTDHAVETEMGKLAQELHLARRGTPFAGCSVCAVQDQGAARRALARRIRCALGMDPEPIRQIQGLGVWR